jgi:uncharacterized membrane protein
MINSPRQTLWEKLLKADIVHGELPQTPTAESPWYIKVLLGFSGWLSAVFLLFFIGLSMQFILKNAAAAFITGSVMIAAAYAILRMPKNEFVEHLALAISLAGQGCIVFSFFDFMESRNAGPWLAIGGLQVLLALQMPNFVHRVFSSFTAALAFSTAMTYLKLPYIFNGLIAFAVAALWLNEFNHPQQIKKFHAFAYGLLLALMYLKGTIAFLGQDSITLYVIYEEPLTRVWMGECLIGLSFLYVVRQLLQPYHLQLSQKKLIFIMAGSLLLCAASFEAQGITLGIMILLLGFSASNITLMGLGIANLLFYVSSYYYFLNISLLNKSFSLLLIGLVLLALRWLMLHLTSAQQESSHA